MSDSDSDEDIKRAIALSLQERSPAATVQTEVIDLVSDSDEGDDDLDAPITTKKPNPRATHALPTPTTESTSPKPSKEKIGENTDNLHSETSSSAVKTMNSDQPPTGLLGLDRKAMEEERLKRQKQREGMKLPIINKKRHASISPPPSRLRKEVQASVAPTDREPRAHFAAQPHEVKRQKSTQYPSDVLSRNQEQLLSVPGVQYPNGVVKKTWVKGVPRLGDDIRIEEVLQKDDLKLAVLSAFQVEPEWVESKLDPKTKVIWVLQAKTDAEKDNLGSMAPDNYRFCFPSMEGNINCMHSKLQLLAYSTHLRVVVPSANLTSYDWGETGVMENVCFLIDLPRLPTGQTATELTFFAEELLHFAGAMGLDQKTLDSLKNFDFSRTSKMAFIHSIGGTHSDAKSWKRTGYCGLGTAIQKLGLAKTDEALEVDFLAASIGSLNETFLKSLYLAAQGDDGLVEYAWRTGKSARNKGMCETERKLSETLNDRLRIYFPTEETVANSRGGIGCGGTICLQAKWYDSEPFPRHLMRDAKSLRPGMLMHSKMMFVRGNADKDEQIAWAYVGSANLSESAWGRLVKDRTTKEPKLTLRNWECGVVFQVPVTITAGHEQHLGRVAGKKGSLDMGVFTGHIPVPMQVPGDHYGLRRPWFNMHH